MPDREHHRSYKKKFTLLLVPDEEAEGSRSARFAPWQLVSLIVILLLIPVGVFVGLLYYTPVSGWMDIPNPRIENRYGKEIIALKEHMADIMGQLVELRAYNAMLRNALGEKALPSSTPLPPARDVAAMNAEGGDELGLEEESFMSATRETSAREQRPLTTFPAIFPVDGYVTRGYEPSKGHYGLDIAGRVGSSVRAAADGYVVFSGWTQNDGNTIILSHAGGFLSFYKHNHSLMKAAGMFVRRGEPIASLGNTGETSLGPHLHFEVWKDGSPRDPAVYILNPLS